MLTVGNGDAGSMLYNEAAYLIPGADEHPFAARFWNGNCTSGQVNIVYVGYVKSF